MSALRPLRGGGSEDDFWEIERYVIIGRSLRDRPNITLSRGGGSTGFSGNDDGVMTRKGGGRLRRQNAT